MDNFELLVTLPHHGDMGRSGNPRSAPVWEADHGHRFTTEQLLTVAADLEDRSSRNKGIEWGDVRARAISMSQAVFLRYAAELRSR